MNNTFSTSMYDWHTDADWDPFAAHYGLV